MKFRRAIFSLQLSSHVICHMSYVLFDEEKVHTPQVFVAECLPRSGMSGMSGRSGRSGRSGMSGMSGRSGRSGRSGMSGMSGRSGMSCQ